jgi:hypothetical protein
MLADGQFDEWATTLLRESAETGHKGMRARLARIIPGESSKESLSDLPSALHKYTNLITSQRSSTR